MTYSTGEPQVHKEEQEYTWSSSEKAVPEKKLHLPREGRGTQKPTTAPVGNMVMKPPKVSGFSHFSDTVLPGFQLRNCHLPPQNHN